jgi:hypothetical protein
MKIKIALLLLLLASATHAYAEIYKYIDNGKTYITDNISNVPEDKRSQIKTSSNTSSGNSNASDSHITGVYKCYVKAFTGSDSKDYKNLNISQAQFDELKIYMEKEYGLNESMICTFVTPNSRLSSPESTWALYKDSLLNGQIEDALGCFSLKSIKIYKDILAVLGKEKMKKIALEMQPIQKIKQDADSAKYRIKRNEGGREITYYIYFQNMFGNWRIENY